MEIENIKRRNRGFVEYVVLWSIITEALFNTVPADTLGSGTDLDWGDRLLTKSEFAQEIELPDLSEDFQPRERCRSYRAAWEEGNGL